MSIAELLQEGAVLGGRVLLAAVLGVLVSYKKQADRQHLSIIHSHAYLAVAGAMFILIIGDQIERAIGLIGVATVIRYRYAIRNPKDAGTLIIALGLGMACGAGLEAMAIGGTLFVMLIIRVLDAMPALAPGSWFAPHNETKLRVITTAPVGTLDRLDDVLHRAGVTYQLTTLERKDREGRMVSVMEAVVQFSGDLDLTRLTEEINDDDIVAISWRETDPFSQFK